MWRWAGPIHQVRRKRLLDAGRADHRVALGAVGQAMDAEPRARAGRAARCRPSRDASALRTHDASPFGCPTYQLPSTAQQRDEDPSRPTRAPADEPHLDDAAETGQVVGDPRPDQRIEQRARAGRPARQTRFQAAERRGRRGAIGVQAPDRAGLGGATRRRSSARRPRRAPARTARAPPSGCRPPADRGGRPSPRPIRPRRSGWPRRRSRACGAPRRASAAARRAPRGIGETRPGRGPRPLVDAA